MLMMKQIALGIVVVAGSVATANDLNPVVAFSVLDQPLDGTGNTLNTGFPGLIRTQSFRADRAMQEFDVGSFAGFTVTSATVRGRITNNNAGGDFPRVFDFELYSGDGVANISDYQIPGTSVGSASWPAVTPPLEFSFDVTTVVQDLLDSGATHVGLKVIGVSSNLFPSILSANTNDAVLTIQGTPGGTACLGDIADDFGFTVNEGGGPDGQVDFGDFVALLGLIGPCDGGTPGCLGDIADDFGFTVNEGGGPDGQVDFGDFVALLGLIGPCP